MSAASAERAVDALDRAHLAVLEAVTLLPGGGTVGQVTALLARGHQSAAGEALAGTVARLLTALWQRALVWRPTEGYRVPRAVADALGPYPTRLGPWRTHGIEAGSGAAAIPAPADLPSDIPAGARSVLDRLTWDGPLATVDEDSPAALAAVDWLVEHRLAERDGTSVLVPGEVGLALRGGRVHSRLELTDPVTATKAAPQDRSPGATPEKGIGSAAPSAAGAQIGLVLATADEVLARWGSDPPRVLRGGGLSVADLRATARALDTDQRHTALLVEVLAAAGLLARDDLSDPCFAPAGEYDRWRTRPMAIRWLALARAWLTMPRAPHLVATRDGSGLGLPAAGIPGARGPVNALSEGLTMPGVAALRAAIVEVLVDAGRVMSADAVVESLRWRRPRRIPAGLVSVVEAVLEEAHWFGLLGAGHATAATVALVRGADDDALHALVQPHLPPPVERVIVQADLTAVAPGPVSGALADLLRLTARVESRGGATIHRFDAETLVPALDAGWSADEILAALTDASATPIPQPLEYLVRDTARRHGQVRVGAAGTYLRSDDEGLLATLLADRSLSSLGLRRIAPTVLVSTLAPTTVHDLMREAGMAVALESSSGVVVTATPRARRATGPRAPAVTRHAVDEELTAAVVRGMRAGQAAAAAREAELGQRPGPLVPATDPTTSLALLREAIGAPEPVWVGYADGSGAVQRLLFTPTRIEGGRVHGHSDGAPRTISIHRVSGVAPAP